MQGCEYTLHESKCKVLSSLCIIFMTTHSQLVDISGVPELLQLLCRLNMAREENRLALLQVCGV
jgi:hypothetical protein